MKVQKMRNYVIDVGVAILRSLKDREYNHVGFSLRFEEDNILVIKQGNRSEIPLEGLTNLKIPPDMMLDCRIRAMEDGELWIDFENVEVEVDDEQES